MCRRGSNLRMARRLGFAWNGLYLSWAWMAHVVTTPPNTASTAQHANPASSCLECLER
jgi:hypothetical protein